MVKRWPRLALGSPARPCAGDSGAGPLRRMTVVWVWSRSGREKGEASGMDLSSGIDPSRELFLAEKPSVPRTTDAANVWIQDNGGEIGFRLGVETITELWATPPIWVDIAFASGRVLSLRKQVDAVSPLAADGRPTIRGAGGMRFQCIEPFKRWSVSYEGPAEETTAANLQSEVFPGQPPMAHVRLNLELQMVVPAFASGSLIASAESVQAEVNSFLSPRYEQLCRVVGELRIGSETHVIAGNGLRIRRQGVREYAGFWGHCWQSAVFPSGRGFGFNTYPPIDGKETYNEGYVFAGDGPLMAARASRVPWLTALTTGGDDVSFVLETAEGSVAVQGVTFVNTRERRASVLPEDFPIIQQAHARYTWDGEETVGMIERSSKPSVLGI